MKRLLANDDIVTSPRRAGARAHLRAMGLDEHDWGRPLVGIATTWTGTMPCNLGQRALAAHVAAGVRAAGGTPLEFNTIAMSDNLTQGMLGMRAGRPPALSSARLPIHTAASCASSSRGHR